jgi:hypothetical protein
MVLLYLKKQPVVEYRVPSLRFWEEALREEQGFRLRRLDRYLSLLLQLLAGLFLVLAAAGPLWARPFPAERVVVALDGSFSMRAVEAGTSRFEQARQEAGRIIRDLSEGARVTLVLLAEGVQELVVDAAPREALEALARAQCASRPLNAALAAARLAAYPSPVILVTDKNLQLGDRIVRVGGALDNVGLIRARYDYYHGEVLFAVKNYSSGKKKVTLSLWQGSTLLDAVAAELSPQSEAEYSLAAPAAEGVLTLKIEDPDALAEDNAYFVPAGNQGKKRVLLLGGDFFVEKALAAMADAALLKVESNEEAAGEEASRAQVVIAADGQLPPALPERAGVWCLAAGSALPEVNERLPLKALPSPLTEGLVLKEVYLEGAVALPAGEGMQVVLKAGDLPVMVAGVENGRRTVYSSLDFRRTNLVTRPDFPLLVNNLVQWLAADAAGEHPDNPPAALITGEGLDAASAASRPPPNPLAVPLARAALALVLALLLLEGEVARRGL